LAHEERIRLRGAREVPIDMAGIAELGDVVIAFDDGAIDAAPARATARALDAVFRAVAFVERLAVERTGEVVGVLAGIGQIGEIRVAVELVRREVTARRTAARRRDDEVPSLAAKLRARVWRARKIVLADARIADVRDAIVALCLVAERAPFLAAARCGDVLP